MKIVNWQALAACHSAPANLFITVGDDDDEPSYPSREALAYCNLCVVKPECLAWATAIGAVGVWGGTTSYQRQQLDRSRERVKCPGCGSTDLVIENNVELCISCGVSWRVI